MVVASGWYRGRHHSDHHHHVKQLPQQEVKEEEQWQPTMGTPGRGHLPMHRWPGTDTYQHFHAEVWLLTPETVLGSSCRDVTPANWRSGIVAPPPPKAVEAPAVDEGAHPGASA